MTPSFASLFVCLCLFVYHLLSVVFPTWAIWILQIICFLLPSLIAIGFYAPQYRSILTPRLKGVGFICLLSLLVSLIIHATSVIWYNLIDRPEIIQATIEKIPLPYLPWENPTNILTLCLIPAVCEESLFRGFLQNSMLATWKGWKTISVSSLLFALGHLNPWQFPLYLLLGGFLGWCQNKWKNLIHPIVAHAINNFVALALLGYSTPP